LRREAVAIYFDGDAVEWERQMTAPKNIGKYEIRDVLGRGAIGVVYRGFQADLNRPVAIKVLIAGQHGSPEMVRRFLREARAAAALSHAGIVQVYDIGADGDRHYIVMELVEGKSLADLLKSSRLKPEEALAIAHRLASALEAAHAKGIVHRDIKPSNILLDARGNPKIADFGLATAIEEQEKLTGTGDILGTAWYMSPEQAFGDPEEVDARTDLYSLGAVLYEMLTGRPPFDGARATAVLKKIETEEVLPPSRAEPSLDPRLDPLVLRALEKNPDRRYPSATEFIRAIRLVREGGRLPGRPSNRRSWVMPLAAVLLVGLGAGLMRAFSPAAPEPTTSASRAPAAVPEGEAAYRLSKDLLAQGGIRKALGAANASIEKGFNGAPARAHRVYLTFLRYGLLHGSAGLTYLHPHSSLGLEQEIDALRSLKASPEEILLAETALLCLKGSHLEAIDRTTGKEMGPLALVRWTALVHRTREIGEGARRKALVDSTAAELARAPQTPFSAFLSALLRAGEGDEVQARTWSRAFLDEGSSQFADPYLLRAVVMDRLGRPELALENLEIAGRIDPEDPLVPSYVQAIRLSLTDEARQDPLRFARVTKESLQSVLAGNPPFPAPYLLGAVAHLIEGRSSDAEDLLQRARLRFGPPDGWGEAQEWGRLGELEDLVGHAGVKGPAFLHDCVGLLSLFQLPAAETSAKRLEEMVSAHDAARIFSLDDERVAEMRASAHEAQAAACAGRGEIEPMLVHLRKCVEAGRELDDVLEDRRFQPYRNHPKLKELGKKR
jgi:serine/threonine-protein kinase